MTITANMHGVKRMTVGASKDAETTWLTIHGEGHTESFTIFMPYHQAIQVAEAFNEYEVGK